MKWQKKFQKTVVLSVDIPDISISEWSNAHTVAAEYKPPLPEAKDIPLNLALDALGAHGIMIKHMNQSTSYSYDGLEFDLSMTILVGPKSGAQTLSELNEWFFSKAHKKW